MARDMYQRRDVFQQRLMFSGGGAFLGAMLVWRLGGVGFAVLAPALLVMGAVWLRGRRPVVRMTDLELMLQMGKERVIRLSNIVGATRVSPSAIEVRLKNGERVEIDTDNLEDADSVWLGRAIKRALPKTT